MSNWVNFRELRERLDFELVLRHYGVEVKRRGNQHQGFCPLPDHQGKKNSPSFSANLEKGIFQCFGCGAKGNILDFAGLMERAKLEDGTAFRAVALRLQERFCPRMDSAKAQVNAPDRNQDRKVSSDTKPRIVNAPLDFELKDLNRDHPYLKSRGFSAETIKYFGLGFASRGVCKDRIAIPLQDQRGRLVGYASRIADDAQVNEDNPRYRFPGSRERNGKSFEFRKTLFLYNGFRLEAPLQDIIVVEGFASVWWLHQNGFRNVVATMGADCSQRQAELISLFVKPDGRVWIVPDGDETGERFAESLLTQLSPFRFTRWVKLGEGRQPTDLSLEQLEAMITV
jgi:DNA primase